MTEYRIVRDRYAGFEVQSRRWWWPFWVQGRTNTHSSVENAEEHAKYLARGGLEKHLGRWVGGKE